MEVGTKWWPFGVLSHRETDIQFPFSSVGSPKCMISISMSGMLSCVGVWMTAWAEQYVGDPGNSALWGFPRV